MKVYKKENAIVQAEEGSVLEKQLLADGYKEMQAENQQPQADDGKQTKGKASDK